jgi:flagellar hook-associated protein 1 FlgK
MGLLTALNTAASGLRSTQVGLDVVASNVANANSIGYSRRTVVAVQSVAGDRTTGVRSDTIERVLDAALQKQLRLETSGAAYTSSMARFALELDRLFGEPGSASSLDGSLNAFTESLQRLASDPSLYTARTEVLKAGDVLAGRIASIAESVQTLRSEAEGRLASAVDRANDLLKGIAALDSDIRSATSRTASPALLDERDRMINELSQLMDVHVTTAADGSVSITTGGGLNLLTGGAPIALSFDGRGRLGPQNLYSSVDAERSVGTITATTYGGASMDVLANGLIRSGEIGAALELRDQTLVQVQRQLDELAAGLSRALSDRQVQGTAASNGAATGFQIDYTGWQPGNAITLDYRDNTAGGAVKRILLVPTSGGAPATIPPEATSDPNATIIRVDMTAGPAAIQAALAARGINLTVDAPAANTFRFVDDGLTNTTDVVALSMGITVTGTTSGSPQLPFFVDSGYGNTAFTGSFEGVPHLTGLAQRLRINPTLQDQRAQALVVFNASPATPQGDTTRPQFLVDALTSATRGFSSASGIGGRGAPFVSTVTDFTRRLVETHGANAEAAQRLDEGQSVALSAIESRFAEKAGVNVDQEMALLVQLQTAYGANARMMTAIRDMMDMLMRI